MRDKETNTEPNLGGDSRAKERTITGRERETERGSRQTTSGRCGHVDRSVASWPKKDRERKKESKMRKQKEK